MNRAQENFQDIWRTKLGAGDVSVRPSPRNHRVELAARLLSPGEHLLDVGCGDGALGVAVRDKFHSLHGIDIAENAVGAAREKGVLALRLDLNSEPLPFESGFFDAITLLSVLQYLYDPLEVLRECYRTLRPNGQLLLSVANMRTLGKFFQQFVLGRFPTTSKGCGSGYDGGAIHYFCSRNVVELLQSAGFAVIAKHGIFFRPRILERLPERLWVLGNLKAEFFGGEIFIRARKAG